MLGTDLAVAVAMREHDVVVTDKELDIADEKALREFAEREAPTHLINCAAHTAVDKCETEHDLAKRINSDGAATLAAVAKELGIFAVQISTDYVFPGDASAPYVEDAPTGPKSVYGKTKLEGEQRFLATAGEQGAIVRTSWLFGVNGASFPRTMLKLFGEKDELRVVDDQRGRPTYTADLAKALVELAERNLAGTWHFANSGDVTWHGFASAILDRARAKGFNVKTKSIKAITTAEYPTPAARPAYSVLSTTKIERALGRRPRAWREALDQYLDLVKLRGLS
jgi:dTDP-4-dehydrorhamnose reductase